MLIRVALPRTAEWAEAASVLCPNEFPNPAATSATGWGSATDAATGVTFSTNVSDTDLGTCAELVFTPTSGGGQIKFADPPATQGRPCVPGQLAFARCTFKKVTLSAGATVALQAIFTNSGGTVLQTKVIHQFDTIASGPLVLEGFDVAPASTAFVEFGVYVVSTGASTFRVGKAQIAVNPQNSVPTYVAAPARVDYGGPSRPFWFGFNDNPTVPTNHPYKNSVQTDIDVAKKAGANIVRCGVALSMNEAAYPNGGPINWRNATTLAAFFDKCQASGLKVLPIVGGLTSWMQASYSSAQLASNQFSNMANLWAQLVATWPGLFPAVEFLNEPNLSNFFGTPVDPAQYTAMLKVVYPAVKAVDPSVKVLCGGVAHLQVDGTDKSVLTWLRGIYTAGGKDYMDAIAVHPYATDPSSGGRTPVSSFYGGRDLVLRQVRQVMGENSDSKRIWVTEQGLNSTGSDPTMTEAQQAQGMMLLRGLTERTADIDCLITHNLVAETTDATATHGFESIEGATLRRKPLYHGLVSRRLDSGRAG